MQRLKIFFEPLRSLTFDDACVQGYGQLRAVLTSKGAAIGANDMQIAAIAVTHGLTLVTHNTREFGRIDGLKLEDWEVD